MDNNLPSQWIDLPRISARSAPLLDRLGQCAIAEDGRDRITMFLPADGLIALIDAPKEPVSEHLLLALGRIVAAHAQASTSRLHPEGFLSEPPAAGAPERTIFTGVAQVDARISKAGQGIKRCWLKFGGEAALIFLMRDGVMPLVWVNFSKPEPPDELLVAVGRLLVAHRSACAEGREF